MNNLTKKVWRNPLYFIAFGFGSGLSPVAPGTMGTLVAIPLYLLLAQLPWFLYLTIVVVSFFLGNIICDRVSTDLGMHDYKGIVWDEIVGYWITMFLAPSHWVWVIVGFMLFRLFDIWKPQPIGWIDKHVHGGLGIMLDDVLAAVFAWVSLQGLAWGLSTLGVLL